MSASRKIVIPVSVVVLAAVIGAWWGSPSSGGVLVLEEESATFWLTGDGRYQGTAVVRNVGDGHAIIDRIDSGCGCTAVVASSYSIGPQNTCQLTFEVSASSAPAKVVYPDLIRGLVRVAPTCVIVGQFQTRTGNQRFGKLPVKAVGEVPLPIALPAGNLKVSDVVESAGHAKRTMGIRVVAPFSNVEAMSLTKGVVTTVTPQKDNLRLSVAVTPEEVDQTFRSEYGSTANVRLSGVLESGVAVSLDVPVKMRVVPPVHVSPSRLIAGPMRAGESLTRQLMFRPDGSSLKSITDIVIEGEGGVSIQQVEPGEQSTRATLRIDADAVTATDSEAVFVVTDDAGGQSRITVPISVVVKL